MYESPIDMLITDIQHQIAQQQDEEVYKAVVSVGINVDKEELLRALKYDRNQYNKGHLDGYTDAMASIVRCKDCRLFDKTGYEEDNEHEEDLSLHMGWCAEWRRGTQACRFCSYGERREGENAE